MSLVNGCVLECHNSISIAVNSFWVKMELYQSGPVSFSICEFPLCHLLMMGPTCANESGEGNFCCKNLFLFFAYHLSSSRIAEYRHVFLVRISKATNKKIKQDLVIKTPSGTMVCAIHSRFRDIGSNPVSTKFFNLF